ncbi:MAG: GNAT family N-acetyltransferase [Eubacteriales bacterium]|nr:GNAT family N-acetyltransferase [Eubacteriales bacterium]MDD3880961.1 GNAT family N-acetyltransferase [Eubacteriales bacterium]MDD4511970.1 GNAT family N-acetyltransferase [Eubacteriales bacterium]
MSLRESKKREEAEFPALFADKIETDWGMLFYMEENRDSYDGNHAFLYPERLKSLESALEEIKEFYISKGIRPSLYHPDKDGYFAENADVFAKCGYELSPYETHRVMLLAEENTLNENPELGIRELKNWNERLASDILLPSGEPLEIIPLKKMMESPASRVFAAFIGEKAVGYTNIHISAYGNTRFDYVVTAKDMRGKGVGGSIISHAADCCRKRALPCPWQWAGPSESLCHKAGFRESFVIPGGYANYTGRV